VARSRAGVAESFINGWRAVRLVTDAIEVTVLPGKGADIFAITDLATGIDPLFKAPWGLAPPGTAPRAGSGGDAFLANYEGGWQELFPNTNDACASAGVTVPSTGRSPPGPGRCRSRPTTARTWRCGSRSTAACCRCGWSG